MIITCEQCQASFNIDAKLIKPSGSKVRCSKCSHVFTAFPPAPEEPDEIIPQFELESGAAADPAPPSVPDAGPETNFQEALPGLEDAPGDSALPAEETLDELDLQLDMDLTPDTGADTSGSEDDDLDLSGIDSLLEETEESVTADEEEDLLANLELESAAEAEALETIEDEAPADIVTDEKIDLSEIEKMLDLDGDGETTRAPATDGPEVELELEADGTTGSPAEDDFDLDEEIDLSEIEKMLEVADGEDEGEDEETLGELELTLERTVGPQEAMAEFDTSEEPGEPTLDVADVDEMLEMQTPVAEAGEFDKDLEDFELEFELDEDSDGDKPADLESSESPFEIEAAEPEAENLEMEMEFDVEVDHPQEAISEEALEPDSVAEKTVAAPFEMGIPSDEVQTEEIEESEVEVEEEEPEEFPVSEKLRPRRKRGIGLPLIIILLIVLAAVAAVVVLPRLGIQIPYLDQVTSRIPFLSQLTQPDVPDPGNLKISTSNINSSFVENTSTGRLFVITGEVKNDYAKPRSFIRVTGKLYSAGKTLAQTESVYCGNVISDLDLSALDRESINKRLGNRPGDKKSNLNVPPGNKLPFMIVFGNLPEDLEEYTIEVVSSTAL